MQPLTALVMRMNKFEMLRNYKLTYKNYPSVMLKKILKRENIYVSSRDGYKGEINKEYVHILAYLMNFSEGFDFSELKVLIDQDKFPYKGTIVTLHGIEHDLPFQIIFEDVYKFLAVAGQTCIDIGGFIGDTAIYFLLNDAKRVIALEAQPQLCTIAETNIDENHFRDRIQILNAGYGEDGEIKVDPDKWARSGTSLEPCSTGQAIPMYSLKTLMSTYNIDQAILKMDCEGCEYNLLKEEDFILRKFKKIQIEYHFGHQSLVQKLISAGFEVHYTRPKKVYDPNNSNSHLNLGYIYATRI